MMIDDAIKSRKRVLKNNRLLTVKHCSVLVLAICLLSVPVLLLDKIDQDEFVPKCVLTKDSRFLREYLDDGADVNMRVPPFNRTILMQAAICDFSDTLDLLLHYGAKVNERDKDGRTAYSLAVSYGKAKNAELLKSYGGTK